MKAFSVVIGITIGVILSMLLLVVGLKIGNRGLLAGSRTNEQAPSNVPPPIVGRRPTGVRPPLAARPPVSEPNSSTSNLVTQPDAASGTLQTINTNGILTYVPTDSSSATPAKSLLTNAATTITLDGKPAKLTALKPGMDIAFVPPPDDGPLARLEVFLLLPDGKPHTKSGPVDALAPGVLTFLAGRRDLFPVSLNLPDDTPVTLDGKPASVADLRYRMSVSIEYQGVDAKSVAASTVIMDDKPHHADGNLVSASPDQVIIHVYGDAGFDIILQPAPDIKIQKESGRANALKLTDVALTDLAPGQHVVATYTNAVAADLTVKLPGGGGGGGAAARPAQPARRPAPNSALP